MKVTLNLYPGHARGTRGTSVAKTATKQDLQKIVDVNELRPKSFSRALTFTGNPEKNLSQIASIAPEYQGLLNSLYKAGGLGNVAGEAAVAFHDHRGMDIRTFVPYYAPENPDGLIKVKTPLLDENGAQKTWTYNVGGVEKTDPAYEFRAVSLDYALKPGEEFVIHEPVIKGKEWQTGYKVLEKTSVSGSVESIKSDLSGTSSVPYHLFKVKGTGVDVKGNPPVYVVHTPEVARFPKSYNIGGTGAYGGASGGAYGGGTFDDLVYGNVSKAVVDAMPKMDTDEFGNYNPGNIWLHDRQAFPVASNIADKSSSGSTYWDGLRIHSTYHNPGRSYQGHYRNPIDYLRIVGSKADLEEVKKHPDFSFVAEAMKKVEAAKKNEIFDLDKVLTKEEIERLDAIFKPVIGQYVDEMGEYNLCKIPVVGTLTNSYNMTHGTVSINYGQEMKNHTTQEIAGGLTRDFAGARSIDITNGSTSSSLKLNERGTFGKGLLNQKADGFTPLTEEVISDSGALFNAKQSNKKWLLDAIGEASEKQANGEADALARLFFGDSAIKAKNPSTVLGGLSKFKEGDTLFIGWGRPDTQKGFPITLESYLQFVKDESIPQETRDSAKFLIGAGPWPEDSADWKTIQSQMKEIATLQDGRYKDKVCYLNGFFTNRVVACADYSVITSRYEPCGITPLESFAGGTPVLSNNTGGSPDFITPYVKGYDVGSATGFLTDHAFFVNPEVLGQDSSLQGVALDEARRCALGKENAKNIREAVEILQGDNPSAYKQMAKNAIDQKIDWHENSAFNGGKCALDRYLREAWNVRFDDNVKAYKSIPGSERHMQSLIPMKGAMAQSFYTDAVKNQSTNVVDVVENGIKSNKKTLGIVVAAIGAVAAGVGLVYKALKNRDKTQTLKPTVVNNASVNNSLQKQDVKPKTAQTSKTPQATSVSNGATAIRSQSLQSFIKASAAK